MNYIYDNNYKNQSETIEDSYLKNIISWLNNNKKSLL